MMLHLGERRARSLMYLILVVASSAATLPAMGQTGGFKCTDAQVRSAAASACLKLGEKEARSTNPTMHLLVCDSAGKEIQCCVFAQDKNGGIHGSALHCDPKIAVVPDPGLDCATFKAVKGEWTPDPTSITANADRKTCLQVYTCTPPPPDKLGFKTACATVVSVSHKQVTQTGLCIPVPNSNPFRCSSCSASKPNEPCEVSFKKK